MWLVGLEMQIDCIAAFDVDIWSTSREFSISHVTCKYSVSSVGIGGYFK